MPWASAALVTPFQQGGHPAYGALPGVITKEGVDETIHEPSPLKPSHVLVTATATTQLVRAVLRFQGRTESHVRQLWEREYAAENISADAEEKWLTKLALFRSALDCSNFIENKQEMEATKCSMEMPAILRAGLRRHGSLLRRIDRVQPFRRSSPWAASRATARASVGEALSDSGRSRRMPSLCAYSLKAMSTS